MLTGEEWRTIAGFPKYEASNHGRVRRGERLLVPVMSESGYPRVMLSNGSVRRYVQLGAAVLLAFVGPKPSPEMHASHLNDDRFDNRPENLAWETPSENLARMTANGHRARGRRVKGAKLTDDLVREIRASSEPTKQIATRLGLSGRTIRHVRARDWWKHVD